MASSQFTIREKPLTASMTATTNQNGEVVTSLYGQRINVIRAYIIGDLYYVDSRSSTQGNYIFHVRSVAGASLPNTQVTITYDYYQYY